MRLYKNLVKVCWEYDAYLAQEIVYVSEEKLNDWFIQVFLKSKFCILWFNLGLHLTCGEWVKDLRDVKK